MRVIIRCILVICVSCDAAAVDDVRYTPMADYYGGQAIIHPANQGAYIYQTTPSDGRKTDYPRYTVGKPVRRDFRLLSAIEEQALWDLKDKLESDLQKKAVAHNFRTRKPPTPVIIWPKVALVDGKGVCVPDLKHQSDPDWLMYSVCYNKDTKHVE